MTPALIRRLRFLLTALLAAYCAFLAVDTLHWPLVGDAALMHYGAFLLSHGFAPYRQIVDMNMPGCFLLDWAVIHVFGPGALAWRLFDFFLIALAAAAMLAIAWPYDAFAGVFAACFLFVLHVHDGVDQAGERDLVLAVLLLIACAGIFRALRRSGPKAAWLGSLVFGLASGAAVLIKPTALPWTAGMVLLAGIALRRRRQAVQPHLLAAALGWAVPLAGALVFLLREHALGAFLATLTGLLPYHASIDRKPLGFLLAHLLPSALYPVVVLWMLLALRARRWRSFEGAALLFSAAVGVASFCVQAKAFPYHRYPLEAFLLLLIGMDAMAGLRAPATSPAILRAWPRAAAAAILLFTIFVLAPSWMVRARRYDWRHDDFTQTLTAHLTALGGPALSGRVQCLDMTAGCLGALYRLRLAPSTGYLYDCYFFHQPQNGYSLRAREQFLDELRRRPPAVIVESNQNCLGEPLAWIPADAWPEFGDWLAANYTLALQEQPAGLVRWWPVPEEPPGYRLYVLRPAAAAATAPAG